MKPIQRQIIDYLDWAAESLTRDEFNASAAELFRAIFGREPDEDDGAPSDHVYDAAGRLTRGERRRVKAALNELW
jgi:hypothetical protein